MLVFFEIFNLLFTALTDFLALRRICKNAFERLVPSIAAHMI